MKATVATVLFLLVSFPCLAQEVRSLPDVPRLASGPSLTYHKLPLADRPLSAEEETRATPPLKAGRVAGELLVGAGAGLAAGYVVGLVGITSGKGLDEIFARGAWGLALGYTIGSAAGVYVIGTLGDEAGSFPKTLLGSTLGMGTALMINEFVTENALAFVVLAPVAATIAFNLSRRYDASVGVGMSLPLGKRRGARVFFTGT